MTWAGYALLSAASAGDSAEVSRLLSLGADPNTRDVLSGYTALHDAATAGHLAVVRCLVEHGAEIGDRRNTVYESPPRCCCRRRPGGGRGIPALTRGRPGGTSVRGRPAVAR
jgi:ankyrin repeat protein